MPPDLVEVFPQTISCAKLSGTGESLQCLLVSAILQIHVCRQCGWMCPVTLWFHFQDSPLRWCTRQLKAMKPCGAVSS